MDDETSGGLPPFADLFNRLVDRYQQRHGRKLSNQAIADALAQHGVKVTQAYLWQLREGQRTDPRQSLLQALGAFFDVPAGYFLDRETYAWVERQWNGDSDGGDAPHGHRDRTSVLLRRLGTTSPEMGELLNKLIENVSRLQDGQGSGGPTEGKRD